MTLLSAARAAFSAPGSLRYRATGAGVWSLADLGMSNALRLASNLVMSHLLLPNAFGVMAMVTTLIVAMNLFTDIGIQQSVIRSTRGDEPHFLRVAWGIQILRSTAIAALVILAGVLLWWLGPLLAPPRTVYSDPDLPFLTMTSALAVVLQGLQSNNVWLAARQMEYARPTLLNVGSQVVGLLAMIGLATFHASVWALLAGMLVGSATKTVFSHLVLNGPRMAFVWDKLIADELWHFGKWIIGSSSLTFVAVNADRMIFGALFDRQTFGAYIIAVLWVGAAAMLINRVADQIGFPVLSEVQRNRPADMRRTFGVFSRFLDAICVAGFVAVAAAGPLLIGALYPHAYAQAAGFMPILSLSILQLRFIALSKLLLACGDSKALMIYSACNAAVLCVLLPFAYAHFGLGAALLAVTFAPLAASPVLVWRASSIVGNRIRDITWGVGILLGGAALLYFFPLWSA